VAGDLRQDELKVARQGRAAVDQRHVSGYGADIAHAGLLEIGKVYGIVHVTQRVQITPADLQGHAHRNRVWHGSVSER
jgi:hypothetical protein